MFAEAHAQRLFGTGVVHGWAIAAPIFLIALAISVEPEIEARA
jgi:hypothetical protein